MEFLLAPRYGYAVLEREERTMPGQRIVRIISNHWKHYKEQDLWLPHQCVAFYYTAPDGLITFFEKPVVVMTHTLDCVAFRSVPGERLGLIKTPNIESRELTLSIGPAI